MIRPFFKILLAINTATHRESVALLEKGNLCAEITWRSARNESTVLLKKIQKILNKRNKTFNDLNQLFVVRGPGPFSAVRIGLACANALAYSLKKPISAITTETLWHMRAQYFYEKYATKRMPYVVISAGKGNFALIDIESSGNYNEYTGIREHSILTISDLIKHIQKRQKKNDATTIFCDTTAEEKETLKKGCPAAWNIYNEDNRSVVLSFGKTIEKFYATVISSQDVSVVVPHYLRPPTITKSKKIVYAT